MPEIKNRIVVCAIGAAFACAWPSVLHAAATEIRLEAWKDHAGNGLAFAPTEGVPDDAQGLDFENRTEQGHYQWLLDLKRPILYSPNNFRYYVIYLHNRHTNVTTRHKVPAEPSGTFEEGWATLRFDIRDDSYPDSGTIGLPVSAARGAEVHNAIEIEVEKEPVPIRLGGPRRATFRLHNRRRYDIRIEGVDVRTDDDTLWVRPPRLSQQLASALPLTLPANGTIDVDLDVHSKLLPAMETSLSTSAPTQKQGSLTLQVAYHNPHFEGVDGEAARSVPIHFQPGASALLLALSSGVILGSLVRILRPSPRQRRNIARSTATAWAAAIILALVGFLLVSFGSEFKLFGFTLDPRELLPILLLGVGCGLLGLEAASKLGFTREA